MTYRWAGEQKAQSRLDMLQELAAFIASLHFALTRRREGWAVFSPVRVVNWDTRPGVPSQEVPAPPPHSHKRPL